MHQLLGSSNGPFPQSMLADIQASFDSPGVSTIFVATGFANRRGVEALLQAAPANAPMTVVAGGGPSQTSRQAAEALLARPQTRLYLYFDPAGGLFHPKLVSVDRRTGDSVLYVGSSNITGGGLNQNVEANLRIDVASDGSDAIRTEINAFKRLTTTSQSASRIRRSDIERLTRAGHLYDERRVSTGARSTPVDFSPLQRFRVGGPILATEFLMVLSANDVSAKHLDGYLLVPLRARSAEPEFWGWPTRFSGSPHLSRTITISVRVHDAPAVNVHGRIYYVASKSEFRIACRPVHELGSSFAGALIIARWTGASALDLRVAPSGTDAYASYSPRCTTRVSAQKRFGYL